MFARSGFAIAMGNASVAVKEAAQLIVADNDSDGWAEAAEHLLGRL